MGYVDQARVLRQSKAAKAALAELQKALGEKQAAVNVEKAKVDAMKAELDKAGPEPRPGAPTQRSAVRPWSAARTVPAKVPVVETEVLVFSVPPWFESAGEFRKLVLARTCELEQEAAEERKASGVAVLGARRVMKQKHSDRPGPGEPRRVLNPRIASRDKWKRVEAIGRLVAFLEKYRAALLRFLGGEKDVVFPHGTYLMRVRFGVACAGS